MSTKYKKSSEVPTTELCDRLEFLSRTISDGRVDDGEFTMRIPAEVDRDADLVLMEASRRLRKTL